MVQVINLVSSSSPSGVSGAETSVLLASSPLDVRRGRTAYSGRDEAIPRSSSLSIVHPVTNFDEEAYVRFRQEWQNRAPTLHPPIQDHFSPTTVTRLRAGNCAHNATPPTRPQVTERLGSSGKKRRPSDFFTVTPIKEQTEETALPAPKRTMIEPSTTKLASGGPLAARPPKTKAEAVTGVRLAMSEAMAGLYEEELRRRFSVRQMAECVDVSVRLMAEEGSFRWRHVRMADPAAFLPQRLFVLDSDEIWEQYIVPRKYDELLRIYDQPGVFLYLMNWRRAGVRHTALLNRQFRQAVIQRDAREERSDVLPSMSDLENGLFLAAASRRLQVNFSMATSQAQAIADLMDFVLELTRCVAWAPFSPRPALTRGETRQDATATVTLSAEIKVKSGKDARDCWIRVLTQIPRITPPVADAILTRYPSFSALMTAFTTAASVRDGEELLMDLRLHGDSGKRIGPVLSARIYHHFCD